MSSLFCGIPYGGLQRWRLPNIIIIIITIFHNHYPSIGSWLFKLNSSMRLIFAHSSRPFSAGRWPPPTFPLHSINSYECSGLAAFFSISSLNLLLGLPLPFSFSRCHFCSGFYPLFGIHACDMPRPLPFHASCPFNNIFHFSSFSEYAINSD